MKQIKVNPNNNQYYSKAFIGGFNLGAQRQYEADIADVPKWIPCSERLPKACEDVLLTCEVRPIGLKPFSYVCIAEWIPKYCQDAIRIDWDEEATEYCEADDEYYPLEGWYESVRNWSDYSLVGIGDFAIAWMPLPSPWKGTDDD